MRLPTRSRLPPNLQLRPDFWRQVTIPSIWKFRQKRQKISLLPQRLNTPRLRAHMLPRVRPIAPQHLPVLLTLGFRWLPSALLLQFLVNRLVPLPELPVVAVKVRLQRRIWPVSAVRHPPRSLMRALRIQTRLHANSLRCQTKMHFRPNLRKPGLATAQPQSHPPELRVRLPPRVRPLLRQFPRFHLRRPRSKARSCAAWLRSKPCWPDQLR